MKVAGGLIAKAEQAILSHSDEYDTSLAGFIDEVELAMKNDEREAAALKAYRLSGTAGTMGWPLVSEIARWLHQVLEVDEGASLTPITESQIDAIRLITASGWKGEHKDGQKLVRKIYRMLKVKGYHLA